MPYVLKPSQQAEGVPPQNWRYERDGYVAAQGEVVFGNAEFERKHGQVWNTNALTLRERTPKEIEAEKFDEAKTDKLIEFFIRALEDVIAVVPEAKGTYDRVPRELLDQAEVAHFLVMAEKEVGSPQKWQQMLQVLGKLRIKRASVGQMTTENATLAEVKAQSWDT